MSKFNRITGFKNYEISESRTVIRNAKTKSIISFEKSGSVRLMNDNGDRVTLNKEQVAALPIDETTTETAPAAEVPVEEGTQVASEAAPAEPVKKVKLKLTKPPKEKKPAKEKKPKPEKKPKAVKPPKEKKERKKPVKVSKQRVKKGADVEITAAIKKILDGEGSKASKMEKLYKETGSVKAVAVLLDTHYSYVYNHVIWYPANPKK